MQSNDSIPATPTNLDRPMTPTSPDYSPLKDEPHLTNDEWVKLADLPAAKLRQKTPDEAHACMSWIVCYDDECWIHASEKRTRRWYPKKSHWTTPTSPPLSPATDMSWSPECHQPPPRTNPKAARKKKTVRWDDQSPRTPTNSPTEPDTVDTLYQQLEMIQEKRDQQEAEIRLCQGQRRVLEDQTLKLRREKAALKRKIVGLEASVGLRNKKEETMAREIEQEKRRNKVLQQRNRYLEKELRKIAQKSMDLAGWEEDDERMLA